MERCRFDHIRIRFLEKRNGAVFDVGVRLLSCYELVLAVRKSEHVCEAVKIRVRQLSIYLELSLSSGMYK